MSKQPKILTWSPDENGQYRALPDERAGLGLAEIKSEGGYVPGWWLIPGYTPRQTPWPVRVTEWPRRKLARGVARLADWICKDRDEGW